MLTLNKYDNEVEFFAVRSFTHDGTDYTQGTLLTAARTWRNLETLVRSRYVVPVVTDRNLLPKMFLRELRSIEYCKRKWGFTPNVSVELSEDYNPHDHTVADVTAFCVGEPLELGRVLIAEVAGLNRSTLVTALRTQALAMVTVTPNNGSHLSTTATAITGTSTNIDAALAVVTSVKFDTATATAFSWTSGTGTLAATAPIHAAGAVDVTLVGFPGGNLVKTAGFTYT